MHEIDIIIKKEINIEMFRNTPKLISLMGKIKGYIDFDNLTHEEISRLISLSLSLIASR